MGADNVVCPKKMCSGGGAKYIEWVVDISGDVDFPAKLKQAVNLLQAIQR